MPLSELTTARNRLRPSLVSRLITTQPAGVDSCGGSPLWILAMVRRVVVQLAAGVESLRGHPVPPLAHPPFPSFTLLWPATVFVSLILSHVTVNQTFSAGHGLDGEHTVVDLGEVRRVTVPRHLCALSPALACTLLTMVVVIII